MKNIINSILKQNEAIFSKNPTIEKINVGFTNSIYNIDNKYIVKICTDPNNEDNFKKEIEFYKSNKKNNLIPKLYFSNTDKMKFPYFYEIIEKLEGVTLYNVWYTLSEIQRENIIRQLCEAMKKIHTNLGKNIIGQINLKMNLIV